MYSLFWISVNAWGEGEISSTLIIELNKNFDPCNMDRLCYHDLNTSKIINLSGDLVFIPQGVV